MRKHFYFGSVLLFSFISLSVHSQGLKWHFDMEDMAFGMAAMADVDGDMLPEIAFSTYRNDERLIVLNGEDGSLLWDYNTGGCNDAAPLIHDVDLDGELEIILAGSCNPKTFCFDARTGILEWEVNIHGSDSPPTIADLDNDGTLEILHGEFGGWVVCINGEDGTIAWNILVDGNSWIQTAPTILDADMDGQMDFIVANWNFDDDHKIFAFRGADHEPLWVSEEPEGVMYHGASHADLDGDGNEEVVIGDYSGKLMVLEAETGNLVWSFRFPNSYSMAAPTAIADLDNDGRLEIVCIDWYQLGVLDAEGDLKWKFDIPNYSSSFRGCAISDLDGDAELDLVLATRDGAVHLINGSDGSLLHSYDWRAYFGLPEFEFNHGPLIGNFDKDDFIEIFVAGGQAQYPGEESNYGIALSIGVNQKVSGDWPMFRKDIRRTSCVCDLEVKTIDPAIKKKQIDFHYHPGSNTFILEESKGNTYDLLIYDIWGRRVFKTVIAFKADNLIDQTGIYFFQLVDSTGIIEKGSFFIP